MHRKKAKGGSLDKRIVAVCSPMRASGVTLTAAALACALAERSSASFAEIGEPYVFDAYGLGKHFLLSGFTDFHRAFQEGKAFRGPENLWHGVHWAVRPGHLALPSPFPQTAKELLRFAERLPGKYTVLDCSGMEESMLADVLDRSDTAFIVVDPLPGKLLPAAAALQRLRYAYPQSVLAVNRMNRGVHRRELDAYLGTTRYLCLPDLGTEAVYKAEYACVLPWDLPEGRAFLSSLKKHGETSGRNGSTVEYMV